MALLASALLVFVPTGSYERTEVRVGPGGKQEQVSERGRTTLLDEEGSGVLAFLGIPVAVAALPVVLLRTRLARAAQAVAALLLLALVFLAAFSIGLFYFPSALAMTLAALLGD